MRVGTIARSRLSVVALIATATTIATSPKTVTGQSPYGANSGPRQALYMAPGNPAMNGRPGYVDAYGNRMILPASYEEPCEEYYGDHGECNDGYGESYDGYGGPAHHGPPPHGGFSGPFPMGAGGTDPPIGYDLMNDVGVQGALVDQRGPHYFDARLEAVFLDRDGTFGRDIPITVDNVGGPVLLSTGQLDYGTDVGFRVIGRHDVCPLSVIEVGFMGLYNQESSATIRDPDEGTQGFVPDLFSLFSEFGTNPANVAVAGGPMPETERAIQHSISMKSDLQTAEVNYRRYWLGYIPRISGTLLGGFRYTKLNEEFEFNSIGGDPPNGLTEVGLSYSDDVDNHLAGGQVGADMWICLCQGLRFGTEGKVGLYNNHATLENRIRTTPFNTTPPTLFEEFDSDHPAFIGEMSVDLVADIFPSISFRIGYELLYISDVALAGDNFNTASPYGIPGQVPRDPFFDHSGEALYQGGHVGIEYIW